MRQQPAAVYEVGNKRIEIYQDEGPSDPREWDNLGTMTCFHKRYRLGDKTTLSSSQFEGWGELREHLEKEKGAIVILPLYLIDHSGISMRVRDFNDCDPGGWDSGQVGFIWVTRETLLKEFKVKRITKAIREKAEKCLRMEVETYDQYLTGDVWGYIMTTTTTTSDGVTKDEDSCWGYFGFDPEKNGIFDACLTAEERGKVEEVAA